MPESQEQTTAGRRLAPEPFRGLVIHSGRGGEWAVQVGELPVACRLTGRLKAGDDPLARLVVGDQVEGRRFLDEPERGVIETILPRRSLVGRGRPGKPPQLVAANLDQLAIVVAAHQPEPSLHTIDRYLALAAACEVPPLLVLNKWDLDETGEVAAAILALYRPLGFELVVTSAARGDNLDRLAALLRDRVTAVIGPSGAGKSSLLNALNPGYRLRCGEVMSIGKGRHTTTDTRLLPLDNGGWVADTPGIKTIALITETLAPDELQYLFPDLAPYLAACRFDNCSHRSEPGCAVTAAVAAGEIAASRHDSYLRLHDEIAATARGW